MTKPVPSPETVGEADDTVIRIPGRSVETLTLDLANADTPEGRLRLVEWCKKKKAENGIILSEQLKKLRAQ